MDRKIIEKLQSVVREIKEGKSLSLFILIKKDDANLWDVVVGGKNLDTQENLQEIVKLINKYLERNELISLSRLVLLNSDTAFVSNLNKAFSVEGGDMELQNAQINNILIKQGHLLFSK